MKKLLLLPLLLLLLVPAAAQGYSFQTPEYRELRALVDDLEDNEYTPARQDEKDAWLQELESSANDTAASLVRVRDEEKTRLAGIYSGRVNKIKSKVQASLNRKLSYIQKWCKRKKRGKNTKQQALIEKRCQAKRNAARASSASYQNKEIAKVEKYWGKSSSRYKSVDRNYERFEENRQSYLARGQAAIEAMPIAVPVNNSPPLISGTAAVGETLLTSPGSWSSSPEASYSYQWQRCNSEGLGCIDIVGATDPSYQITLDDFEKSLRVVVTATNIGGDAQEPSSPTVPVAV